MADTIDWTRKGRDFADSQIALAGPDQCRKTTAAGILRWYAEVEAAEGMERERPEAVVRREFGDLLAAVRWTAVTIIDCTVGCDATPDGMEAEAVRLLTEGLRARLKEIANG